MSPRRIGFSLAFALLSSGALAQNPAVTVTIDATANRHPINPDIYGVAFASKAELAALNAPLNRSGGNAETAYNWKQNATNLGQDWYYESYPGDSATPGADADKFVSDYESRRTRCRC